ncbi:SDR family NAD(P)-dependent oxidoreductase [Sorangium sp. So ce296]|uniref:type I polyketide synthase n=1 Tax=Sorangium sp. So ce296 TaxID=3133296 RepID=UPI003F5F734C
MSTVTNDTLTEYLRRLTQELHRSETRLRATEERRHEPIAIVGLGLRLPGGIHDRDTLWTLLEEGRDAIAPIPASRWNADATYDPDPDAVGKSYVRDAAMLDRVDLFDADFFGISPREAKYVDPQHRLLLETSWQALEDAGIVPASLRDSKTGVFVGTGASDYAFLQSDRDASEAYAFMGMISSFAAGRLAFTLGLQGPALSIDTACSSSLVALHLACQSLRQGECDLALAAGVQVMSSPEVFVLLSRTRALASDGRSKTFSANADGYGRGEGVVVLAVERLRDARAKGHPILAVIRGSAVNHDGTSSGITVPNGPAQQKVLRAALDDARLVPADVDVVECHGTGTSIGDPIEVNALAAVYGEGRPKDRPLFLGALKTNIGHLEFASGLAGVAKMVASMRHATLPATLHTSPLNPLVDWDALPVRVVDAARPWTRRDDGAPRRAGVTAIGLSGTNAHVIVEEAPAEPEPTTPDAAPALPAVPVLLSGKTDEALRAQAARLHAHLAGRPDARLVDIAASLATTRTHFDRRAAVVAADRDELLGALDALARGEAGPGSVVASAIPAGRVVFVFPGQGSQWVGMARALLASSAVFRDEIAACERALAPHVAWSLGAVLRGDGDEATLLGRVDVVQPVLFAVMVALAALWRSIGVTPDAVVGHSQGEIAAAYVAGALSLEDAAKVVALRARALTKIAGRGAMAAVELGARDTEARLAPFGDAIAIAAINSPRATLVAGDTDAIDALVRDLGAAQIFARKVRVDYASHSAHVEAIERELLADLAGIEPRAGAVPLYSAVTGAKLDGSRLDAAHWFQNLRSTVRFEDATRALHDDGHRFFVEVSPHPVLALALDETLSSLGGDAAVVSSLRRDEGDLERFLLSAGELHARGHAIDWGAFFAPLGARRVTLPTYAFQRERFWLDAGDAADDEDAAPGASTEETAFWQAIERGDVAALSDALHVADSGRRSALESLMPALSAWRRSRREQSAVGAWRYRVEWRPVSAASRGDVAGTWLVVAPAGVASDLASALAAALTERGADVVPLALEASDITAHDAASRLRDAIAGRPAIRGVLTLTPLDTAPLDGRPAVPAGLARSLALVQALAELAIEAPIWIVTRGAVAIGRSDRIESPVQAMAWGLGRVVSLEQPERWGGLVDLPRAHADGALDATAIERLVAALGSREGEDELALRPTGLFARRLARAPLGDAPAQRFEPRGTVLVTGGTGALGAHVARWLARHGAAHLVLASRRGADAPGAEALRAELTELGARVTIAACDVADRAAIEALFAALPAEEPLTAIFHTAGVIDDGVLGSLTPERLETVLHGKADAARTLHELTKTRDLAAFVLFSSAAGVFGNAGQASYAAANAFLDALAEERRALGLRATSVAWGAWAGAGMLTFDVAQGLRRGGFAAMEPEIAVAALASALDRDETHVTIASIDWARFAPSYASARQRPLIADLPDARRALDAQPSASTEHDETALVATLRALSGEARLRHLVSLVLAQTAAVLGHADRSRLDPQRGFFDLGLDSLMAVELRRRLQKATGVKLPATITFDRPSPHRLAGFLLDALPLGGAPPSTDARPRAAHADASDEPIAIVGVGLRLPGGVDDVDALFRLLEDERDAVAPIPASRWDVGAVFDPDPEAKGKTYVRHAAMLDRVDLFDAGFFGISPREARHVDPQHRLLLETAWQALEAATIVPASLRDSTTGVFVGAGASDYAVLQSSAEDAEAYAAMGTAASFAAGRLAFTLGLQGPALSIDTACSSSLVALHLACQSLRQGECDLALAAGVQVMASPEVFVILSRTRALAPDGRSKTFSANADGFGRGEGVVVLALERLRDARANGHPVLAVVRGTAVNHDGASSGITAPNGSAQQKVLRAALDDARLAPTDVDVVECHGTGTSLGDPIEVQALAAVYGEGRAPERPLRLGAVKTNIGHLEFASGLAGVVKIMASLRHGTLPATIHTNPRNPHIDWDALPVRVVDAAEPWERSADGSPRRAGVSAFGLSGTNAHVIVEEAPDPDAPKPARGALPLSGALPFVLSAKSDAALRAQAAALRDQLARTPDAALVDVAAALATTRSQFDHRAAIAASDHGTLVAALEGLAAGVAAPGTFVAKGAADKLAFLFTGQGAQRAAMGRGLYDAFPVFRDALDAVASHFDRELDRPLRDVLFAPKGSELASLLDRTEFTQPALFALEVALFRLVEAWGVTPDVLLGHSVGELAAAHVAGVLSLADACTLVAARARLMQALPARDGAMVTVHATEAEVLAALEGRDGRAEIAAINAPSSTVIAGDVDAVLGVAAHFEARGRKATRLRVSHAFHSHHMDPMLDAFRRVAEGLTFHPPRIPIVSNVTGRLATDELRSPDYWVRHVRSAVRFADGINTLEADGVCSFFELGPHGVLSALGESALANAQREVAFVPALRDGRADVDALTAALSSLHVRGHRVDWAAFFGPFDPQKVALPTYAFQRERFWLEAPAGATRDEAAPAAPEDAAFWRAVDAGDVGALGATLNASGEDHLSALATLLPALSAWRRARDERSLVDALRYRVVWKPLTPTAARDVAGTWLLVTLAGAEDALARELERALTARGAEVIAMPIAPAEADRVRLAVRVQGALADAGELRGIVSFAALDETTLATHAALPAGLALTLRLVQALGDMGIEAPLWLVTRGAVSTGRSDRLASAAQSMTWGLGRVAGLEHPERWGGLVDVADGDTIDARALDRLVTLLASRDGEDQLALRPTGIFARRLVRAPLGDAPPARTFTPRGTSLVTGGTGALGAHVARFLAGRGAEHLVLVSRRGEDAPGAGALRAELEALGARVTLAACDVADRASVAALLARLDAQGDPVRAVVHAGGVVAQAALASTDLDGVQAVVAAKVLGALHLHELLGDRELDAFVLFASGAGVWGSGQQGAYAAGNAFLDALAEVRRAAGLTATSIAWGAWAGAGMLADHADADAEVELRKRGLVPMAPALAIAALAQALDHGETAVTVASVDWARFAPAFASARPRPLLLDLPEAQRAIEAPPEPAGADGASADRALVEALRPLSEADRARHLVELVVAETAAVLGHADASAIDPHKGFFDLGLDSLVAVELLRKLRARTGVELPATVTFDHPSPHRLATYVREALPLDAPLAPADATTARSSSAHAAIDEPIAIVGLGLRLPGGVEDREGLWSFLEQGRDGVGPIPKDRWDADTIYDPDPEAKGKSYVREAALLDRVDLFDASFFGISPREAKQVDPQHRLLLETAWQALEEATIVPASLKDTSTGVFVGIGLSDYALMQGSAEETDAYAAMGTLSSFAAGRLAFTLGLQGPALSIDTACSSSLVALHLACQSLRKGECDLALAGGVQVMTLAEPFVLLSRTRALAADGRSKTFSAHADGYGRGEGVVVLALERLRDAEARGRRVLAVVRGTAVNHDGASSGITAPNGTSQQKVLRAALGDAGLAPADVDVVECHGTGTALGDPIEVQALAAVYGEGRAAERPLLLGAVKSNIGHLEAASGLAGVAKIVTALEHGALPATIHSRPRNPHVDWDALHVRVVDAAELWARRDEETPRRAGVSAFGLSGTNAHAIIEEAPRARRGAAAADEPPPAVPVVLSAKSERALRAQAERLRAHVTGRPGDALVDVAASLATTRSHFEHRAAIVARDLGALEDALAGLAEGRSPAGTVVSRTTGGKLALLFTGQGGQRAAMGRGLYGAFSVFRDAFDAACSYLDRELEHPLRDVVFAPRGSELAALLDETLYTQTSLFALEVALFRLVEAWGVTPHVLLGHSIGELVAAHVAGVLSLEDACTLVAARARLMHGLPRRDAAMVAVHACEREVLDALDAMDAVDGRASIAAVNAPSSTVVAGDREAVLAVAARFEALGRKTSRLRVSHAFHSHHLDPMLEAFRRVAEGLRFEPPRIPIVSNVTGARASNDDLCTADYWVRHARGAVRFADGLETLRADGVSTFLELGPHAVLCALGHEALGSEAVAFLPALREGRDDVDTLTAALGALHARGHHVDWDAFFAPFNAGRVALPTYAFQRERFWLDMPKAKSSRAAAADDAGRYPLAGTRLDLPDGSAVHTLDIGPGAQPYLADHSVYGRIVVPGAFHLAVLLAVAESHWPDSPLELRDVEFVRALTFEDPSETVAVRVHLTPAGGDGKGFHATVATQTEGAWTTHATATLGAAPPSALARHPRAAHEPLAGDEPSRAVARLMASFEAFNVEWGPKWRWLRQTTHAGDRTGVGYLAAPDGVPTDDAPLPGGLVDNAFAVVGSAVTGLPAHDNRSTSNVPPLPFSIERLVWYGRAETPCWADFVMRGEITPDADRYIGDITLWSREGASSEGASREGTPIATIEGLAFRRAPADKFLPELPARNLYALTWPEQPAASRPPRGRWALLGEDSLGVATGIAADAYPDVDALRDALGRGAPCPDTVAVCLAAAHGPSDTDETELVSSVHTAAARALALLNAWLSDERLASSTLVLLTQRAVATCAGEDVLDLASAALWGLVRSAQAENRDRAILLVDLDGSDASRRALPYAVGGALDDAELQLALRDGRRLAPRLARVAAPTAATASAVTSTSATPRALDPEGTVLVTGGTGTLGALVARRLVERHGVKHLVLLSRRGAEAPGASDLAAELQARGASVVVAAADAADRAALERVLLAIPHDRPLTAVVHAAGTLDDGVLSSMTPARLSAVLQAKVDAAVNLDEQTRRSPLRAFVLFSSLSGVLGSPAQSNYAAANAFLDALAHRRAARGLPAVALDWGYWAQTSGLTKHLEQADLRRIARGGLRPLASDEALALFDLALAQDAPCLVPAAFDADALRKSGDALSALLRGLVSGPRARAQRASGAGDASALKLRLASLAPPERHRMLLDVVRADVATVLGVASPLDIEPGRPLQELGLDSLMAIELRNRLAAATGLRLSATLLFDHPTPEALAKLVSGKLLHDEAAPPSTSAAEIDRLEGALASAYANEAIRDELTVRMKAILSKWMAAREPSPDDGLASRLDTANDDELFRMIDHVRAEAAT